MSKVKSKEELQQIIRDKWGGKRSEFDQSIQDCIMQLAGDSVNDGVDLLKEIAIKCKTAGMNRNGFVSLCLYIEQEAIKLSEEAFVQMKIRSALQQDRKIILH